MAMSPNALRTPELVPLPTGPSVGAGVIVKDSTVPSVGTVPAAVPLYRRLALTSWFVRSLKNQNASP